MIVIILICIPLAFALGGFVAFKGVQLGLRWNAEAKTGETPTMENPIQRVLNTGKTKKVVDEAKLTIDEWLNGEQK